MCTYTDGSQQFPNGRKLWESEAQEILAEDIIDLAGNEGIANVQGDTMNEEAYNRPRNAYFSG